MRQHHLRSAAERVLAESTSSTEPVPKSWRDLLDAVAMTCGMIIFESKKRHRAQFLRVKRSDPPEVARRFLADKFNLEAPHVLLRVVGSMGSQPIADQIEGLVEGLFSVAAIISTWLMTDGLDEGLTQVVGEALARSTRRKPGMPLVGVAPWHRVYGRDQLVGKEPKRNYRAETPDDPSMAVLEGNHTHFLFVERTTGAAGVDDEAGEQSEHERYVEDFDRAAVDAYGCPRVLLLVQGGPEHLELLARAVEARAVVVVAALSGGLAEALYTYAAEGSFDVDTDGGSYDWSGHAALFEKLRTLNALEARRRRRDRPATQPLTDFDVDAEEKWPFFLFFTPREKSESCEHELLRAVWRQAPAGRRVQLAVEWGRPELLHEELARLPGWDEERAKLVNQTLQFALEAKSAPFVKEALELGADLGAVDLYKLCTKLQDGTFCKYPLFHSGVSDEVEQQRTRRAVLKQSGLVEVPRPPPDGEDAAIASAATDAPGSPVDAAPIDGHQEASEDPGSGRGAARFMAGTVEGMGFESVGAAIQGVGTAMQSASQGVGQSITSAMGRLNALGASTCGGASNLLRRGAQPRHTERGGYATPSAASVAGQVALFDASEPSPMLTPSASRQPTIAERMAALQANSPPPSPPNLYVPPLPPPPRVAPSLSRATSSSRDASGIRRLGAGSGNTSLASGCASGEGTEAPLLTATARSDSGDPANEGPKSRSVWHGARHGVRQTAVTGSGDGDATSFGANLRRSLPTSLDELHEIADVAMKRVRSLSLSKHASKAREDETRVREAIAECYPRIVWQFLEDAAPWFARYWRRKLTYSLDKAYKRALERQRTGSLGSMRRISDGPHAGGAHNSGGNGNAAPPVPSLMSFPSLIIKDADARVRPIDVYLWCVLLGETEMAVEILKVSNDPLRAAITGAHICNVMAEKLPIFQAELEGIGAQHEQWAIELLNQCSDTNDARLMLTAPSFHWERSVIQLAEKTGMKNFASHRFCQDLCDQMMLGSIDEIDGGDCCVRLSRSFLSKPRYGLLLLHAFLPIPGLWLKLRPRRRGSTWRWYHFYAIPLAKQALRSALFMCYVLLFSAVSMRPQIEEDFQIARAIAALDDSSENAAGRSLLETHGRDLIAHGPKRDGDAGRPAAIEAIYAASTLPFGNLSIGWIGDLSVYEIMLFVWTMALVLDEWHQWQVKPGTYEVNFWNRYDRIYLGIFAVAFALRACPGEYMPLLGELSNQVGHELMALDSLLVWLRLLQYFAYFRHAGILVITILKMVEDMIVWLTVSAIFLVAFSVTILSSSRSPEPFDSHGPLGVALWAIHGEFDLAQIEFQDATSLGLGPHVLWVYVMISNVVLVNLLIAMMSDTYTTVKEHANREWMFERLGSTLEMVERMHVVPPPFSLPILVASFCSWTARGVYRRCCGSQGAAEDKNTQEDGTSKPAQWAAGGNLWTVKVRAHERTQRAMLDYLMQHEREKSSGIGERLDKWDARFEQLAGSIHMLQDEVERLQHAQLATPAAPSLLRKRQGTPHSAQRRRSMMGSAFGTTRKVLLPADMQQSDQTASPRLNPACVAPMREAGGATDEYAASSEARRRPRLHPALHPDDRGRVAFDA